MRNLGPRKEHGGGIGAGRNAGAAADAGGRIHGFFGGGLGCRDGIGILCASGVGRNESAGLDNYVKCTAVDDQIFDDRKGLRPPRFDNHGITI